MGLLAIPTQQGVPFWTQRSTIDGREYNLQFYWNQREARWYLNIADGNEDPIVSGIKLVTNWPLLAPFHYDERLPAGELAVLTRLADASPPGLNDLGIGLRCELTYIEP